MTKKNIPYIIAHRGNCDGLPENSLSAFKRAIHYNADGIETDVQLTKDNIPVIFHDNTSFRLTGRKKRIFSYTLDDLQQFNLNNEKIPTLATTLELFSSSIPLYIEIKTDRFTRISNQSVILTKKVIKQVLNLSLAVQKNIFILSFDPDVLKQAYSMSNTIKCVLNLNGKEKWCIKIKDILNKTFDFSILSGVCINLNNLTSELVNFAHMHNIKVFTYSCNTEKQLKKLLGFKLDGIMTDRAEWLTKRIKYETRD